MRIVAGLIWDCILIVIISYCILNKHSAYFSQMTLTLNLTCSVFPPRVDTQVVLQAVHIIAGARDQTNVPAIKQGAIMRNAQGISIVESKKIPGMLYKAQGILKVKVDGTQDTFKFTWIQDNYIKIIQKFKISHWEAESHAFCIQPKNI